MYVEDGDDPLPDDDVRLALPDQGSNDPVWRNIQEEGILF